MEENQNLDDLAEESAELPKVESQEDLARIIQALVFASPDIVTLKKLREILGDFLDARLVSDALIAANDSLNKINSPFEIVVTALERVPSITRGCASCSPKQTPVGSARRRLKLWR